MNEKIKDGGPAFPLDGAVVEQMSILIANSMPAGPEQLAALEDVGAAASGMSLRDYFAAKALQGMLSDLPKPLWGLDWKANVSKASYELADEMLKARIA